MSERSVRTVIVVVDLFAAVSAFAGALGLVVGYMHIPLSVLHATAFVDFTVPALLLGFVVGGSALAAALITLREADRSTRFGPWRFDALASAVAGGIMVGWISIEIALIGLGSWLQPLYFVVGLLMLGLARWMQWMVVHQQAVSIHAHAHSA